MSSEKKVSIYTVSGGATFRGRNPLPHPTSLDLSSCSPLRKKWLGGHNPQKSTHAALCTIGHHAFAACGYDLHEILDSGSSDDGPEPSKEGTLVLEIDSSSTESGISADSDDLYGDGAGGKRETPGTEEEVLSPGSSSCPIAYSCMYNKSYEEPLDIILEENEYDYRLTRNIVSENPGRHPSGGVISATVPAAGSRGGNKGCVGEGNDACDGTVVVDSPKKKPRCDDPDVIGEQGAVGGPSHSPISPVSLQSPSSTLPVTESSTVSPEDLQSPSSAFSGSSSFQSSGSRSSRTISVPPNRSWLHRHQPLQADVIIDMGPEFDSSSTDGSLETLYSPQLNGALDTPSTTGSEAPHLTPVSGASVDYTQCNGTLSEHSGSLPNGDNGVRSQRSWLEQLQNFGELCAWKCLYANIF